MRFFDIQGKKRSPSRAKTSIFDAEYQNIAEKYYKLFFYHSLRKRSVNMKKVKALIITGFGINCEVEMAAAYEMAGADASIVHLNDILLDNHSIHDYDIINFPGGFSFGDDLASGRVLANKMRFKKLSSGSTLLDEIKIFLKNGKFILGICNGFQMLVKMGILPNVNGNFQQEVTLTHNDSAKYENRWVHCKTEAGNNSPFLEGINQIEFPVRHGEGKLIIKNEQLKQEIIDLKLNCLSYTNAEGESTDQYPLNPNGSDLNCAGLTDPSKQVFGLMPHPEAYLSLFNHPDWSRKKRLDNNIDEEGEGLKIFRNIVGNVKNASML